MDVIKELVLEKYGESFYHKRLSKGKKVANAQEAHEAIRPVYIDKEMTEYSGLEPYEFKLLDLIRKRTIASQMAAQVFDVYTVTIKLSNSDMTFISKFEKEVFQGWMILYKKPSNRK